MTAGIGPEVSYAYKIEDRDVAAELKWLPETGTSKRLNGDTVWFKLALSLGTKPADPLEAI
jgi:hypothetical protein